MLLTPRGVSIRNSVGNCVPAHRYRRGSEEREGRLHARPHSARRPPAAHSIDDRSPLQDEGEDNVYKQSPKRSGERESPAKTGVDLEVGEEEGDTDVAEVRGDDGHATAEVQILCLFPLLDTRRII